MTTAPPAAAGRDDTEPARLAVQMRGLRKVYGDKVAVDHLDLAVPAGTFFGLVGPNGAGKSTTLKIATGLLRPDGGSVTIDGADVWSDPAAVKSRIGIVPEDLRLFERLTGRESLEYTGLLRGLDPVDARDRASELVEVLGLDDGADRLVVDYSSGMRKKLALGNAILHQPSVLFLDEPFESVDPLSVRVLRAVLERLVEAGSTVVFSSHVMEVVERLCDHVAIVHQGRIVAGGPTAQLCAGRRLEDVFADAVGSTLPDAALTWLQPR